MKPPDPMNLGIIKFLWIVLLLSSTFISSPATLLCQADPASEWHLLYQNVRDGRVAREEARRELRRLEASLRNVFSKDPEGEKDDRFCFPLEGYSSDAIGGKGGSGYRAAGYDFFEGNAHKGHPGHDLFIRDKDQDQLDDRSGRPVAVLSASAGMVVSVNSGWEASSPVRGGNYIWIFEPGRSRYFYYAHLDEIFVRVGQVVSPGDRLGTVGRTGVNAYPKRSPTHLHFVVHRSRDGCPIPVNPYPELLRAKQTR
jgi:peptidoglycan LD-endopeptidase LytH